MVRAVAAILQDLRVLVIDDDANSAKLLAVILRAEGCVVRLAGSAEDARAVLRDFWPRVIVTDLVLPKMNGLVLIQLLKTDPATRDIVIVAVTALHGQGTERLAIEAGCARYLRKPIDPLGFPKLLTTLLRRPRAPRTR